MESSATPYKIVFFDGDEEHEKGHVGLNSLITFKRFQALVSQKLGFSQSHLCNIVFVCRRAPDINNNKYNNSNLRRLPINERTNFGIILNQHDPSREKDCYFLVSMKNSRKERKGKGNIGTLPRGDTADGYGDFGRKPDKTILSRGGGRGFQLVPGDCQTGGFRVPLESGFEDARWFNYSGIIDSQRCYGTRRVNRSNNNNYSDYYNNDVYYRQNYELQPRHPEARTACQLCSTTNERPVPFHLCVHDAIIRGTRGPSPAGPIQRPPKRPFA